MQTNTVDLYSCVTISRNGKHTVSRVCVTLPEVCLLIDDDAKGCIIACINLLISNNTLTKIGLRRIIIM